jgi:chorismate dehydratase
MSLVKLEGVEVDAVFHDPFSPYKNPEMWSIDLLSSIKRLMKREGMWVSYSSSLPVRKALIELGFTVGRTPPVGRRRGGTVASFEKVPWELTLKEVEKLRSSPYSIPFRDPELREEPLRILIDYRLNVLLRERASFSEGRRELRRRASSI